MKLSRVPATLKTLSLVFILLLPPGAMSQEVWIKKASALLAEPLRTSAVQGLASPDTKALVKERKGIWLLVESDDGSGWVRLAAVRYTAPGGNIKTSLSALKTGREGSGNNVAATGVRGMDAKMLTLAKPNFEELALLDDLRTDSSFTRELQEIKNRRKVPAVSYRPPAGKGPPASESARPALKRIKDKRSEIEDEF